MGGVWVVDLLQRSGGSGGDPTVSAPPSGSAPVSVGPDASVSVPARSQRAKPHPKPSARHVPVRLVIYNVSRYSAPGRRAVSRLRSAGYQIVSFGAIRDDVSETTVYYDPATVAAAHALVAARVGVVQSQPRPPWLDETGTLIVAVTANYSG